VISRLPLATVLFPDASLYYAEAVKKSIEKPNKLTQRLRAAKVRKDIKEVRVRFSLRLCERMLIFSHFRRDAITIRGRTAESLKRETLRYPAFYGRLNDAGEFEYRRPAGCLLISESPPRIPVPSPCRIFACDAWIQMHLKGGPPFQIFPGIFSSIDSDGKRLIHGWFDRKGSAPPWLSALGDIKVYVNPPHFSKFDVRDVKTSVVLSGTPDGILVREDKSHIIVDYKTAKITEYQDELFPMYEGQLNAYAYIAGHSGLGPVSGLALVYTEPVTDYDGAAKDVNLTGQGFNLGFKVSIVPVQLKIDLIPKLQRKGRRIFDSVHPPIGLADCENCALLESLIALAAS